MSKGKARRLLAGILIVLVVAVGLFAIQLNTWLKPVPAMAQEAVMVAIPSGSSSMRVANILAENKLIRNAAVFRYYAKFRGMDQGLQAGNYIFSFGMTMDEILRHLLEGNVYRPTVTVTIPEGYTVEQIAQRLEATGLVDAEVFLTLVASTEPELGKVVTGQRYAMEGYLFPDTYEFDINATPQQILQRLQARLGEVLTPARRERAAALDLDIHEVLTLASLVEREVQAAAERDMVAGVMFNRLQKKMPLQLCASVIYALGVHKTEISTKDTQVESPYNTYKYSGLPPGPIASPGESAIDAVLNPADVDYLYYVVKGDGSGEHYFGLTFAEHQANIAKSQQNEKKRK
ncbi:MAG TPA: endolytic transglycosylase MltG [Oscillospiraceae bacterium]|nr:endolytic transglycosylase MltG [Oscillospiraceae bacterium]